MNDEPFRRRVVLNEENQFFHSHVEELNLGSNSCNGREWTALNLSVMPLLRVFQVGKECFKYVDEVKLIGLNQLERIVIGKNSFTEKKYANGSNSSRHFYVKNCERLRDLKIGCWSFSDYSVCEIWNVPSLEVIEMGEVNHGSDIFYYASLELKSDPERMK